MIASTRQPGMGQSSFIPCSMGTTAVAPKHRCKIATIHAKRGRTTKATEVQSQDGDLSLRTIAPGERILVSTSERMDFVEERAQRALKVGLTDVAYAYAYMALEQLLSDLALQHGLKIQKISLAQGSRDLVSRGIISREALDALEQARTNRNRLMHAIVEFLPSAEDVSKLLALGKSLCDEMITTKAQN